MEPSFKQNIKLDEKLNRIRRQLRQHLTSTTEEKSDVFEDDNDYTNGLYLEMFSLYTSDIREKHFYDCLKTGETFCAKIVSKLSSNNVSLKLIQNKKTFLNDLQISASAKITNNQSFNHLDVNDVISVVVVHIIREEKKIICKLLSNEEINSENIFTNFPNISFDSYLKNLKQFQNPFVLKDKAFSSLLFNDYINDVNIRRQTEVRPKVDEKVIKNTEKLEKIPEKVEKITERREIKVEKKKRRRSPSTESSTSSSSTQSSSSTTTSSSSTSTSSTTESRSSTDEEIRRKRKKKRNKRNKRKKHSHKKHKKEKRRSEKSSKKISFVVKKTSQSLSTRIPGFEQRVDDSRSSHSRDDRRRHQHLSSRMRRQLERDAEIERKIHLLSKTVQKF